MRSHGMLARVCTCGRACTYGETQKIGALSSHTHCMWLGGSSPSQSKSWSRRVCDTFAGLFLARSCSASAATVGCPRHTAHSCTFSTINPWTLTRKTASSRSVVAGLNPRLCTENSLQRKVLKEKIVLGSRANRKMTRPSSSSRRTCTSTGRLVEIPLR